MSKYRYYIEDVEVFPQGEWEISYQRNEGQIFFRRIFDGELTFRGADYDLIKSFCCRIITFDIYCGGAIHWQGQFQYPYKVKFDADSCIVVLTPEVVDEYTCILNNYDVEYSNTAIGGAYSIVPSLYDCTPALINVLPTCYTIYGYIEHLLNHISNMNCGVTVKSSFMWRDNFANGDNYAAAYATNNYITGLGNRLEYIYLAANSGIRSTFGGTVCELPRPFTFKDFEDLFRNAFNAYWFFDENGDFRIEHIYYFDPAFPESDYTIGTDLNTVMDRGGRSYAYRRNKYEYETGRMYDQEKWTWQHFEGTEAAVVHGSDFEGVPVFYGAAVGEKSNYVPGEFKEKELATPSFWADIEWAWALVAAGTLSSISCPTGFCMLDILPAAVPPRTRCEVGAISGVNTVNAHCSTANLLDNYHQYDRIFKYGDMNSGDVLSFQTAQKHKLQDPIEFPLCCNDTFDPLNRIRTGLGDGEVKAAVQKKQSIEVELWHEFDCSVGCMERGVVVWDGVDDYIDLSAAVDCSGLKRVVFNVFLKVETGYGPGANYAYFFDFGPAASDDFLSVQIIEHPGTGINYLTFWVSQFTADVVTIPITGLSGKCLEIIVEKDENAGVGTITSITFNSVAQALANPAGFGAAQGPGDLIAATAAGGRSLYSAYIWDITVYDISGAPAAIHNWIGYPAGNTDAAWVDNVGAIDGTVNGTPDILTC